MEILEINENSLLITLEGKELEKYFPSGAFDLSDQRSRIALREMLADACHLTGREQSDRVEMTVLGDALHGFNIFCRTGTEKLHKFSKGH